MFSKEQFIHDSTTIIDWISTYLADVENFSVRAGCQYGEIKNQLPSKPPREGEEMETIFDDFKTIILPGITHWQSPKFFAYFPANSSEPSLMAEFLTAALGVQGMKWITSPAATELEQRMMQWLQQMIGLPDSFTGVIQDTASVSTLCAILAARERATRNRSNVSGLHQESLRVYCSTEAHSSIEKAVRIAGIGSSNLIKIPVDAACRLIPEALQATIESDKQEGFVPACIVGALGTTGTCAVDPLHEIGLLAKEHGIWFHIDAAFAGTALILPEYRKTIHGVELADSFVFNPHKWMFTNFDCSAFFVKDPAQLQDTFQLVPSYLQTGDDDHINDYSNWGIQLGRRFRALKLWFVIRSYGVEGIRSRIREHIHLSEYFQHWVAGHPGLEMLVPPNLVVNCFRYKPANSDQDNLNRLNELLLERINSTGKLYISHTYIQHHYALRFVCAQTHTEKKHIEEAIRVIEQCIHELES